MNRTVFLVILLAKLVAALLLVLVPGALLARALSRSPDAWKRLAAPIGVVAVPAVAALLALLLHVPLRWPLFVGASVAWSLVGALLLRSR